MDYKETLDWLFRQLPMFSRTGAAAYKPGLDTSLALDCFFGHPHRRFRSIHVGGTNGKGSVSHNIASILQEQGYRTGLYTSPHLADFRERIRVDGEMIPEEAVVDFVERFRGSSYSGHPSFFELTMMMAFDWFARREVDFAVVEVGMGGRLDSTNIITPIACVITNISKDHTQFLGDIPEKIAEEKAGIIKKGVPVVIGEAEGKVKDVFVSKANQVGAPLRFAKENPKVEEEFDPSDFTDAEGIRYSSPLGGHYQRHNLNTVLTAVEMLRADAGVELDTDSVVRGIAHVCDNTHLAGRWMKVHEEPLAIADTGHNVAGISQNMSQIKDMLDSGKYKRLKLLIGFVADKDIDNILALLPKDSDLYICNASIPRALPAQKLAERCEAAGLRVEKERVFDNVAEGWRKMLEEAEADDLLYIGGSTFVVADFLATEQ